MSIFTKVHSFGKSSHWSRPALKSQPARRHRDPRPFGEGIVDPAVLANTPVVLAAFPVEGSPEKAVALIEDDFWHTREPARAYRYSVVLLTDSVESDYAGTDSLRDAQALVSHWTTPLPDTYADEAPELPLSVEHDPEDELWWAQHAHEAESELDAWLDSLAPADYETMGMEGGAR